LAVYAETDPEQGHIFCRFCGKYEQSRCFSRGGSCTWAIGSACSNASQLLVFRFTAETTCKVRAQPTA